MQKESKGPPPQMVVFLLFSSQRLLGLSMEDPTPTLHTLEVVGGLKTRLFEGPKSIGSLWVFKDHPKTRYPQTTRCPPHLGFPEATCFWPWADDADFGQIAERFVLGLGRLGRIKQPLYVAMEPHSLSSVSEDNQFWRLDYFVQWFLANLLGK